MAGWVRAVTWRDCGLRFTVRVLSLVAGAPAGPASGSQREFPEVGLSRRSSPVKPQASTHPPGWEPSRADEPRIPQRVTDHDAEAAREPPICTSITPPGCPRQRALNDHSVLNARMTFQAADTPAKQLQYASPSQSSVFLYVLMVKICWLIQRHTAATAGELS